MREPIEKRLAKFMIRHLRARDITVEHALSPARPQMELDGYVDFEDLSEAVLNFLEEQW